MLLDLPIEIIVRLLSNLDGYDLLVSRSVCHLFKHAIDNYSQLQYNIELYSDYSIDTSASNLSSSEKLSVLLKRRTSWSNLSLSKHHSFTLDGVCSAYELVGGVFAKIMPLPDTRSSTMRYFSAVVLPETDLGMNTESGMIQYDTGIPARDFAIDPSQDLIALLQADGPSGPSSRIRVHLRTLSAPKPTPHPLASMPILSRLRPYDIHAVFIQIACDVLGIFFIADGQQPRVMIWNWMAGILYIDTNDDLPYGINDFAFLTRRSFILTSSASASGSLKLYSFGPPPTSSSSAFLSPTHQASLFLPLLQHNASISDFSTHSGPATAHPTTSSPFSSAHADEERIHVVSIQYTIDTPPQTEGWMGGTVITHEFVSYWLFVPSELMISYTKRSKNDGSDPKMVEWEAWGPRGTRMLQNLGGQFHWLRYCHGHRLICPSRYIGSNKHEITVLDFNPRTIRRLLSSRTLKYTSDPDYSNDEDLDTFITYPSSIYAPKIFADNEVVTSLPYLRSTRVGEGRYSGFMIDEQRILAFKNDILLNDTCQRFDVFTFN